jgi:excisionase family DNA binding protein
MENIIRLSVSEAAKLFGVSTKTIRQALKNQELKYIVVKGRYKINFNSLVEWSQQSTRRFNLLKNQGLGQYVDQWKIRNRKYSPNPELINKKEPE